MAIEAKPERLTGEQASLERTFSRLFAWERRKKVEQALIALGLYAVVTALALLPLNGWSGRWISPWLVPAAAALALAPVAFLRARWRNSDALRAVARFDRALGLQERAITAWETLSRPSLSPAWAFVISDTAGRLSHVDPRPLSPRERCWQLYAVGPLLVLWFALVWLDRAPGDPIWRNAPAPRPLAQKLAEFGRRLQEQAAMEELPRSLSLGQELERMAHSERAKTAVEERLAAEIATAARRIEAEAVPQGDLAFPGGSSERLRDLRMELEVARDALGRSAQERERRAQADLAERLSAFPQLRREIDRQLSSGNLNAEQLARFFDQLEKRVVDELDRRTLIEAQQVLQQLARRGRSEKGPGEEPRVAGTHSPSGAPGAGEEGAEAKESGSLPGSEPGRKPETGQGLPDLSPAVSAELKGRVRPGESAGLVLRSAPAPEPAKAAPAEAAAPAAYRQQAEAALRDERIPESLKETIRNYFLSLGSGREGTP